jgi:DNA-directed RNA polymerase alpha subunit
LKSLPPLKITDGSKSSRSIQGTDIRLEMRCAAWTYNCLKRADITKVGQVLEMDEIGQTSHAARAEIEG